MHHASGKKRQDGAKSGRHTRVLLLTAVLVLLFPRPAAATYDSLEEIPVESPLYGDLESLALRFGAGGFFLNRRPWTRGEAVAYLEDLRKRGGVTENDPSLIRVEREVSRDARGARPPLWSIEEEGRRLEVSPYAQVLYEENRTQRPVLNRDYRIGAQASARAGQHLLLFGDWYAGTASQGGHGTPDFGTTFALAEGADLNGWLDRAYVALDNGSTTRRLRATLGHTWIRWGPGATGTLGVSDAAPALDQLRFDVGLLRRVNLSWFVASLDAAEERFYAAHRVSLAIGGCFEVGIAEEARFDGTDQVLYYLIPGFPYTFIEKRVDTFASTADTTNKFTKNNAMASVDFTWRLSRGLCWYGEFLLDDYSFSSTFKPKQIGWQTGVHTARTLDARRVLSGRAEYARIYNFVYTVWHNHDFTFGGQTLGYVLGPDAEQVWGQVALDWGASWRATVEVSRIRKGEGAIGNPWLPSSGKVDNVPLSGVVENRTSVVGSLTFQPVAGISVEGRLGFSDGKELDYTGYDRSSVTASMGLRARW